MLKNESEYRQGPKGYIGRLASAEEIAQNLTAIKAWHDQYDIVKIDEKELVEIKIPVETPSAKIQKLTEIFNRK